MSEFDDVIDEGEAESLDETLNRVLDERAALRRGRAIKTFGIAATAFVFLGGAGFALRVAYEAGQRDIRTSAEYRAHWQLRQLPIDEIVCAYLNGRGEFLWVPPDSKTLSCKGFAPPQYGFGLIINGGEAGQTVFTNAVYTGIIAMKWLLIPLTIWSSPASTSPTIVEHDYACIDDECRPAHFSQTSALSLYDFLDECRAALRERSDPTDAVCVEVHGWTRNSDLEPY